MKKLLLSSSFITIVVMGINFIFKIYLSYKISKEEIGVFYTFLDLISIGVMFFSGFKDSLILSFDKDDFKKTLYWYKIVFLGLFILVLIGEVFYYQNSDFKFPLYFLILLLFFNSLMLFFSYLNASHKIYKVMLFENMVMAIGLIGSFFFLNLFLSSIYSLFFAFMCSYIFRILYILLFSKVDYKTKKSSFYEVKNFMKNTVLSGGMYFFSGVFISMSGIILLKLFNDLSTLSEYQVVVRSIFFSLVTVFIFPLNTFTFPHISKFISQDSSREIARLEKKFINYLVVFFILLVIGTFFTKSIIGLVFPKEYLESYKMLNILLPFLPFIAYTTFSLNIIKAYDRFDLALLVRVFGSLLFFISIYIFYLLGFDAKSIVYSLDISFLGMFLIAFIYKKRLLV